MNRTQMSAAAMALAVLFVAACGKSEPPPKKEDTVFGPMLKAKERAVTETDKAMEANRKKLEEAMKKNEEPKE